MKKLLEKRKDIVYFLKIAPISQNPQLERKSKAIVCNGTLKNLEEAFEGAAIPMAECETRELEENGKFMQANGLNGVPVSIFPDGSFQVGFVGSDVLEKRIDEAMAHVKGEASKKKVQNEGKK
jgi:thiol:disulfide interchange protein DsbC